MKKSLSIVCSFIVASVLGVTSPALASESDDKISAEEVKKETRELLEALNAYTVEQRDEAVQRAKEALDRLDRRIEELDAQLREDWERMDQDARQSARENLEALLQRRMELAEWYGGMKNSAGEAWEHVKSGFADAYREFSKAWEESEEELEDNQ